MTRNIVYSIAIILVALVVKVISNLIINNALTKFDKNFLLKQRALTIATLIKNTLNLAALVITIIMLLDQWGINIAPIITSVGIAGLAVGFGAQALVRDIVTGIFILIENQYNVGDKLKIAGLEGRVKEITLRSTILQDDFGTIHIIPNSSISIITKLK
ncbi:hypothetical protein A2W32_05125 [candidate division WWE3 bacterium RBG_16_37_10]|uniref:Mechanosensitive ion channel protein MscS n=1 Tax=candidate division WWE3 bacterium RBG_16_37_10 TaxID=1802610 RepID=A0A1F4V4U9_UNCKA|nr:MAG: hypothetical protein A2W32_05125 [candidate division WWE3 bacterium RBG_16_37_10]